MPVARVIRMAGEGAGNGGGSVLKWALSLLAAAVAIRLAITLLMSVMPELIGIAIVASLGFIVYRVQRYRHNRW
jgi:hypothetical protein